MEVASPFFCRRESKIGKNELSIIPHQDILGLQVPVINPDLMASVYCIQNLDKHLLDPFSARFDTQLLLSL